MHNGVNFVVHSDIMSMRETGVLFFHLKEEIILINVNSLINTYINKVVFSLLETPVLILKYSMLQVL